MIYIVPSRGRPDDVRDLIKRWDEVTEDTYLHIALDSDDPELQYTLELLPEQRPFFLTVSITEPRSMVETVNAFATTYAHAHEAIGFMSVKSRPETIGWDDILRRRLLKKDTHFVWPGHKIDSFLMTSNIVREFGGMIPPVVKYAGFREIWHAWVVGLMLGHGNGDIIVSRMLDTTIKSDRDLRRIETDENAIGTYLVERLDIDLRKLRSLYAS